MTETITTQWGSKVRCFNDYSADEKLSVVSDTVNLMVEIKAATDIDCMLSYGGLLGAVRDGKLIAHDFDIDVIFFSKGASNNEIVQTCFELAQFLQLRGYELTMESNGQFKAVRRSAGKAHIVEFFVGWVNGNDFYQYFAIKGAPIADKIFPLGVIELEGVSVPAPASPEALMEAIYGPTWQIPDSGFSYKLSPKDWEPFKFLFVRTNKDFWEGYYSKATKNKVFVSRPSQFATFFADNTELGGDVLDFGCGNGRDGLYFAELGYQVTMMDFSSSAIDHCLSEAQRRSLVVDGSVLNVADVAAVTKASEEHLSNFDRIYTRFFLHAVNESGQHNFLNLAAAVLRPDGLLFAEFRVKGGEPVSYENGEHYRRLQTVDEVREAAAAVGLSVEYSVTSTGFSKYHSEDPLLARMILRKSKSDFSLSKIGKNLVTALKGRSKEAPNASCPVCASKYMLPPDIKTREVRVCKTCKATGRDSAIVDCVADVLGFPGVAISRIAANKSVHICNLSGSQCLSTSLSRPFSYLNTYYHKAPFLNVLEPQEEHKDKYDLLINSEVMEHVVGNTVSAFKGCLSILKKGGTMIFSVPFINTNDGSEHYPGLVSYETKKLADGRLVAELTFEDGRVEIDENSKYHGGSGSTLELRLFDRKRILSELDAAGFVNIVVHDEDKPEIGIRWGTPSRIITAERPRG